MDLIDLVQVSDFVVGTLLQPDRQVPATPTPLRRCLELVFAAGYPGFVDLELLGPAVEAEGYESAIRRGMVWLTQR